MIMMLTRVQTPRNLERIRRNLSMSIRTRALPWKCSLRIDCWKLERSVKSVSTAVVRSITGSFVTSLSKSCPTEWIRCLIQRLPFWKQLVLCRSSPRNWLTKLRNQQQPRQFQCNMRLTLMVWKLMIETSFLCLFFESIRIGIRTIDCGDSNALWDTDTYGLCIYEYRYS
jgi:hypothetical protein